MSALNVTRFFALAALAVSFASAQDDDVLSPENEARLLTRERQLTFEGKRAGEGYYNRDGSMMIFQSERDPENPFYQIYLMDLDTGDVERVSPGTGKTTCSWVHPSNKKVLFASTHADPDAVKKQEEELAFRASGQERRYSWDYDPYYDIYEAGIDGSNPKNLTNAYGYDAEGSYSPDGEWIAFASNRHAYTETLSEADKEAFERDPAFLMDIYLMKADGSDVRRLTDVKGYDGGPFFSPDGKRITWRRFSESGATAEVYTMNVDGTEQKELTHLGAMSWAPYYHPTGDYLIFTTNRHGFANFELYLVDALGAREPVRVTYTDGFDGLPVFHPDGAHLAWTSNRTPGKTSQIFTGEWNDGEARKLLGLNGDAEDLNLENAPDFSESKGGIDEDDMRAHITYLASDELEGRKTGTRGEKLATAYVASVFEKLGLQPAGDDGTYFQSFDFTAGVNLGKNNALTISGVDEGSFTPDTDWRPLAYSKTGDFEPAEVVFAGYAIQAEAIDGVEEYDSFVHLDVKDKWVLALRYMPENLDPAAREHLNTHSSLRYKAMTARDLGAKGLIVASGPNSQVNEELVKLTFDASLGGTSVAAICVTDAVAQRILDGAGKDLKELQDGLDEGSPMMGFTIPDVTLSATIDIAQERRTGRNVLARLYAGEGEGDSAICVGAHVDHLGVGPSMSSLLRKEDKDSIHHGADDNASGTAGLLEIAQYLVELKNQSKLSMKRDALFAAWSGEELGLLGANHFTAAFGGKPVDQPLTPEIAAYLNMDMIGRMDKKLILQGVGSSSIWPREIEQRNAPIGLPVVMQNETYLPTDATAFYIRGVPFLNAFTGAHIDYHTPRDTADKIDYPDATKIAKFMGLVARSLVTSETAPDYKEREQPENMEMRANMKAYLGTIPDYAEEGVKGLKLSGVTKGAPADDAGLKQGDIITKLAGRAIENIYDYTYAIEALKVNEEVEIVVNRNGEELTLTITPGSRE